MIIALIIVAYLFIGCVFNHGYKRLFWDTISMDDDFFIAMIIPLWLPMIIGGWVYRMAGKITDLILPKYPKR